MAGFYGTQGGLFGGWPGAGTLGETLLNTNPDEAYTNWMRTQGYLFGADPRSQFARQQRDTAYNTYATDVARTNDLGLTYTKWLQDSYPHMFGQAYGGLSPNQRGDRPQAGRVRYVGF